VKTKKERRALRVYIICHTYTHILRNLHSVSGRFYMGFLIAVISEEKNWGFESGIRKKLFIGYFCAPSILSSHLLLLYACF